MLRNKISEVKKKNQEFWWCSRISSFNSTFSQTLKKISNFCFPVFLCEVLVNYVSNMVRIKIEQMHHFLKTARTFVCFLPGEYTSSSSVSNAMPLYECFYKTAICREIFRKHFFSSIFANSSQILIEHLQRSLVNLVKLWTLRP